MKSANAKDSIIEIFDRRPKPEEPYDVIVCGSGPAGIGAAVAASMNGAKTALFEARSQLGGTPSAAMWMEMNYLFKDNNETDRGGVNKIFVDRIRGWGDAACRPGNRMNYPNSGGNLGAHPEYTKKVLFDMMDEFKIDYQLYSPVIDVIKEGNKLTGVVIAAKEGLVTYKGKIIIDATGDGDVAYLAGCEMSEGDEQTGWRAPVTVSFALGNVDTDKFWKWLADEGLRVNSFVGYKERILKQGLDKGYNLPTWAGFNESTIAGVVSVNSGTSKEYSVDPSKSYSLTYMEKAVIDQAIEFVRWAHEEKLMPGMEKCCLVRTGGYAMARETRRLVGEYVFTDKDVMKGSHFDDTVATKYGGSDPVGHEEARLRKHEGIRQGAEYPYRCFLPKDIDGLLVAGRCASASMLGHYGGKSIGNMLCMGQAAGVAAALCVKNGVQPRKMDAKCIRRTLDEMGVSL